LLPPHTSSTLFPYTTLFRFSAETGATVVPSFDDPAIIVGQGTAGLEIIEQLGHSPARIVIPCGGGGLAAGIALAAPKAEIIIARSEEHTSELQSRSDLVCRLL